MKHFPIYVLFIFLVFTFSFCKKKEVPEVDTNQITNITGTSAKGGGEIINDFGENIIKRGICWSKNSKPDVTDYNTSDGSGSGNFSSTLTNLDPATTYYVRAYAINSSGTGYGMELSFSTLGDAPSAITKPASDTTVNSAVINGTVNANFLSTVVSFEYGLTTDYGNSAVVQESPLTGGAGLDVSAAITGLLADTTYHFRIKAVNSIGTTYGDDLTLRTLGHAPSAATANASDITLNSAVLNGTVNANYLSTTVSFEYGTTLTYGNTFAAAQNPVTGNLATNVSAGITSLTPGTLYHFRVKAVNSLGTTYGSDLTFSSSGLAPTATTTAASGKTLNSAVLNGNLNPNLVSTLVTFEYGLTSAYGNSVPATENPITGNTVTNVSAAISELSAGTTYHFRVKAENSIGISYGTDLTFTTLGNVPTPVTTAASGVGLNTSVINGTVNANYLSTAVSFEYGTTSEYGSTIAAIQSPVTGNSNTSVSANLTALSAGTTYHFRVKAVNMLGTTYGNDLTLTTLGHAPTALTKAASGITLTSSTLNGTVNANLLSTQVIFEYGVTSDYGDEVTAIQSPVSGSLTTAVNANLSVLTEGTTYHFRVKAVNSLGTTYGNDLTFTTLGSVPLISSQAVNVTSASSVTLKSYVNPNYLSTVVTFEYGTSSSYGSTIDAVQNPLTGSVSLLASMDLTGLTTDVVYHFRVKAENSLGITYGNDMTFTTNGLTDIEGNFYPIVTIGSQTWMASNLKTTKYNDNTDIPLVTDQSSWIGLSTPAYCWYTNNESTYKDTYGALYNWFTVSTGKLCPSGWHVPTNAEFTTLTDFLGGISVASGKIKETGTVHWADPNVGATNESGFTALPSGQRTGAGDFIHTGVLGVWWSTTPSDDPVKPWYRSINNYTDDVFVGSGSLNICGFSIRCIKD